MITIANYGSGNIGAITNLLHLSNLKYKLAETPNDLKGAEHILLPGVGAFDPTMNLFNRTGLADALRERVDSGAALMGICVGMHVLAGSSEEGEAQGLGFIPGNVRRFDESIIDVGSKVPHMGWNSIEPLIPDHPILKDVDLQTGFYFLHSYYFDTLTENTLAVCDHGKNFACITMKQRVIGIQFHPEKSHSNGLQIFKNFLDC